jgi:hypothetical protein
MHTKAEKQENSLVIYQTQSGEIELRGDFLRETILAHQIQIADIFGVDVRTVNEHIKNIYKSNELDEISTIRKIRIVQNEGRRIVEREINHYNLDMIIAVGYRVNSKKATQFRIWATKTLREFLLKGYTINKKRLQQNHKNFLKDVELIGTLNHSLVFGFLL